MQAEMRDYRAGMEQADTNAGWLGPRGQRVEVRAVGTKTRLRQCAGAQKIKPRLRTLGPLEARDCTLEAANGVVLRTQ